MILEFFMEMEPPTATAQEKKVSIVHGKPVFYEPTNLKAAKLKLTEQLLQHKPTEPIDGPIHLEVIWRFSKGKRHKNGEWRITKPDTDNLQKMLKDCMTRLGFWKDDAQVCREAVIKIWTADPPGIAIGIYSMGKTIYTEEIDDREGQ